MWVSQSPPAGWKGFPGGRDTLLPWGGLCSVEQSLSLRAGGRGPGTLGQERRRGEKRKKVKYRKTKLRKETRRGRNEGSAVRDGRPRDIRLPRAGWRGSDSTRGG